MMCGVLQTLCCCLLVTSVTARNPGLKARITSKGLNYANSFAIQSLQASIRKTTIPNESGKSHGFKYEVYNMHVTKFSLPSSGINLVPGKGLAWAASGAFIEVKGDFKYKSWIARDHGSFTAKISSVAFNLELIISSDESGRPRISAGSCHASVGDVDFKFHGGMAWLYNLFRDSIGHKIRDKLNKNLCPMITKAVNVDAEKKMEELPMKTPLAKKFLLDYLFTAPPLFTAQFMETYHKGEVFWRADPSSPAPMTPHDMPDVGDNQSMLTLELSDYVLDTFLYQAQKHGFLVRNVTANDLPPSSRGVLNTTCPLTCIGKFISAIGKKYPNSTVELRMSSTRVPDVNISPSGVYATFGGNIDLYARVPGKVDTPFLITLMANMSAKAAVSVGNRMLFANVSDVSLKLKSGKSAVGPVDDKFLNFLADNALKMFIIPKLNEAGRHGFPLPVTKEITFINTKLSFAKDTIEVSTDLTYTPSERTLPEPEVDESLDDPDAEVAPNKKLGPLKFRPYFQKVMNGNNI